MVEKRCVVRERYGTAAMFDRNERLNRLQLVRIEIDSAASTMPAPDMPAPEAPLLQRHYRALRLGYSLSCILPYPLTQRSAFACDRLPGSA